LERNKIAEEEERVEGCTEKRGEKSRVAITHSFQLKKGNQG